MNFRKPNDIITQGINYMKLSMICLFERKVCIGFYYRLPSKAKRYMYQTTSLCVLLICTVSHSQRFSPSFLLVSFLCFNWTLLLSIDLNRPLSQRHTVPILLILNGWISTPINFNGTKLLPHEMLMLNEVRYVINVHHTCLFTPTTTKNVHVAIDIIERTNRTTNPKRSSTIINISSNSPFSLIWLNLATLAEY